MGQFLRRDSDLPPLIVPVGRQNYLLHNPCLFKGVPVCLLDSRNVEGGGYPVRPPVTCIDISHVAEEMLNFQVGQNPVRLIQGKFFKII